MREAERQELNCAVHIAEATFTYGILSSPSSLSQTVLNVPGSFVPHALGTLYKSTVNECISQENLV